MTQQEKKMYALIYKAVSDVMSKQIIAMEKRIIAKTQKMINESVKRNVATAQTLDSTLETAKRAINRNQAVPHVPGEVPSITGDPSLDKLLASTKPISGNEFHTPVAPGMMSFDMVGLGDDDTMPMVEQNTPTPIPQTGNKAVDGVLKAVTKNYSSFLKEVENRDREAGRKK